MNLVRTIAPPRGSVSERSLPRIALAKRLPLREDMTIFPDRFEYADFKPRHCVTVIISGDGHIVDSAFGSPEMFRFL